MSNRRSVAEDDVGTFSERLRTLEAALPPLSKPAISRATMINVLDFIDHNPGAKLAAILDDAAAKKLDSCRATPPAHLRFELSLAVRMSVSHLLGMLTADGTVVRRSSGEYHIGINLWLKLRRLEHGSDEGQPDSVAADNTRAAD
jgi:hypothetical protein